MWGVPAIAFSVSDHYHARARTDYCTQQAGDNNPRPYTNLTDDPYDTSRLAAGLGANLVSALADGTPKGERIFPLGVGVSTFTY